MLVTALTETGDELMSYKTTILGAYEKLLDEIEISKPYVSSESYNDFVNLAVRYRRWVLSMTGLDDVRPAPDKM
ncbi:hypothetical protein FACS1894188_02560 [Clostridia bacterium]|nr:hypothetical protein FACS1894188_02560 [Clostridia bacterium]